MSKFVIFIGLIGLILISCNEEKGVFEDSYVISYKLTDQNCVNIIKNILKPTDFENDDFRIRDVYQLEVSLDSIIYKNSIFKKGLFVGLVPTSDSVLPHILCLFPLSGEVRTCHSVAGKLIVDNCWFYSTPMNDLGKSICFGLDTTYSFMKFEYCQIGFWSQYGTSWMDGRWQLKDSDTSRFVKDIYNNIWDIRKKQIYYVNDTEDTLFSTRFTFNNRDSLVIKDPDYSFQILGYTESCIILYDFKSKKKNFLYRIE